MLHHKYVTHSHTQPVSSGFACRGAPTMQRRHAHCRHARAAALLTPLPLLPGPGAHPLATRQELDCHQLPPHAVLAEHRHTKLPAAQLPHLRPGRPGRGKRTRNRQPPELGQALTTTRLHAQPDTPATCLYAHAPHPGVPTHHSGPQAIHGCASSSCKPHHHALSDCSGPS